MIVGEDSYFGLFVMFHFLSIANVNQTNGVKVESRVEIMILSCTYLDLEFLVAYRH